MQPVGIDAVAVWSGKLKLDLPGTFAPVHDEDPEKYTVGLGLTASSLPDSYEDIVTMGANAAHKLLTRTDTDLAEIGRIDVATESAFDNSKPVSTYISGCLESVFEGDLRHADKGERKFACLSATQCLNDAYNWIAADRNRGRKALVISTDTALYERGDAGEATQGAGAVAMLVAAEPDLVAFSHERGIGSLDETDFLKPNQQFPSVDGKRSVQVYLARMREALEDFKAQVGPIHPEEFAYGPFHTPYPGMVRKAAVLAFRNTVRGTALGEQLATTIGPQPTRDAFDSEDDYVEAIRAYTDKLADTDAYTEWYTQRIEPTLRISSQVGNWYTSSVHLARISALLDAAESGRSLTGETLLVGSYGSGAEAEIHAETVQPGWTEAVTTVDIDEQLAGRREITFDQYERVHATHNHESEVEMEPVTTPEREFVFDGWGPMGEREYRYVE